MTKAAVTISIFNQKGGVGKSTTASNLMASLTLKGKKVLGIDIDAQGHLTKFLNVKTEDENTVMEILSKRATFTETVKSTRFGDIIPCDRNLVIYIREFSENINNVFILQKMIKEVRDSYDFIIIDCPPNANQITVSALIASNFVIVPTEAEYFSLDGVTEISLTLKEVREQLNPSLKVLGVLLVKYQPRRSLTKQMEGGMEGLAKNFLNCKLFDAKINYGVAVPSSQAMKKSVFEFDKNSKAAKSFMSFTEEVIKGVQK